MTSFFLAMIGPSRAPFVLGHFRNQLSSSVHANFDQLTFKHLDNLRDVWMFLKLDHSWPHFVYFWSFQTTKKF